MSDKNQLPEAPASATVKVKSAAGFEWLFTVRSEAVGGDNGIFTKIAAIENRFTELKWTPLAQNAYGKREAKPVSYVEGRVCPKDGAKIVIGSGKVKENCEHYKYDFTTKKNVGSCDYIVWN